MILQAGSKAGKSFALLELCVAVATGGRWMGLECKQGAVAYLNLELTPGSCRRRVGKICAALDVERPRSLHLWNLRGHAEPFDQMVDEVVERLAPLEPALVVVDPYYKVCTGNENEAESIGRFVNALDRMSEGLGSCSVAYAHHHSKADQRHRDVQNRGAGSGVFGRDADAIVDLIPLAVNDRMRAAADNAHARKEYGRFMDTALPDWREKVGSVDKLDEYHLRLECRRVLDKAGCEALREVERRVQETNRTREGQRVEVVVRDLPPVDPFEIWIQFPLHIRDEAGILKNAQVRTAGQTGTADRHPTETQYGKIRRTVEAMQECERLGVEPTVRNVAEHYRAQGQDTESAVNELRDNLKTRNKTWYPLELEAPGPGVAGRFAGDKSLYPELFGPDNLGEPGEALGSPQVGEPGVGSI